MRDLVMKIFCSVLGKINLISLIKEKKFNMKRYVILIVSGLLDNINVICVDAKNEEEVDELVNNQ